MTIIEDFIASKTCQIAKKSIFWNAWLCVLNVISFHNAKRRSVIFKLLLCIWVLKCHSLRNIFSNIKGLKYPNAHCYGIAKAYIALVWVYASYPRYIQVIRNIVDIDICLCTYIHIMSRKVVRCNKNITCSSTRLSP